MTGLQKCTVQIKTFFTCIKMASVCGQVLVHPFMVKLENINNQMVNLHTSSYIIIQLKKLSAN